MMEGTMPGARRRGRPRAAWMDNIKMWTGLPVEESIKTSRHGAPWWLDFDTPLSAITTLIPQSPLPSRLRSWLPSYKPSLLYLGFFIFPFPLFFFPSA